MKFCMGLAKFQLTSLSKYATDGQIYEIVCLGVLFSNRDYNKISNVRHNESQNLNDSRLVLHLSLPNLLKLGVKWRMKM